jgi:hypothetical protein
MFPLKQVKKLSNNETDDMRDRILRLRAEGKNYRQIAQILRISIATISRTLNQPSTSETEHGDSTLESNGEMASAVFEFFEKGKQPSQVVIDLKIDPDRVKALHEKWHELKGLSVFEWAFRQTALEDLLTQARGVGRFRFRNCANINEDGYCTIWTYGGDDGKRHYRKGNPLRCAFCDDFEDAR